MINFRFHLVSLVAVFLALTIGIVMGATVIDRAVVDSLNDRINAVSDKADKRKKDNDQLAARIARKNKFVTESQPYLVNGTLTGVPVVVVAMRGVNPDAVKAQVQMLQQAGAEARGIVWLESTWALRNGDAAKLATVLGATTRDPASLRDAAWRALSARFVVGGATPANVAPAGSPVPAFTDGLAALTDAGFVALERVGDQGRGLDVSTFPGTGARALLIGGPTAGLDPAPIIRAGARALVAAGVPTVAAEIFVESDATARGDTLKSLRSDAALTGIPTVDDVELAEGQIAAVLAEADLGRRPPITGHYGYGDGAERVLPQWQP